MEVLNEVKNTLGQISKADVINSTYEFTPATQSIFNPVNLDPQIKMIIPVDSPARGILPRTAGAGQAATWHKLTSKLDPSATGTGTAIGFADAGTPSSTTQTYSTVTAEYKLLGRELTTGILAQESSKNMPGGNIEAKKLREKMIEVMLGEEDTIFNGDSAQDANEFDGLAKTITTNSGTASLLTASGVQTYAKTLFDAGAEGFQVLFCNPRQALALNDELYASGAIQQVFAQMGQDQENFVSRVRVTQIINPFGGRIDVVPSRYVGAWAYLTTVRGTNGQNYLEMEDLIPMSSFDIAASKFGTTKYVAEATVLKVIAEEFQYKIGALATS